MTTLTSGALPPHLANAYIRDAKVLAAAVTDPWWISRAVAPQQTPSPSPGATSPQMADVSGYTLDRLAASGGDDPLTVSARTFLGRVVVRLRDPPVRGGETDAGGYAYPPSPPANGPAPATTSIAGSTPKRRAWCTHHVQHSTPNGRYPKYPSAGISNILRTFT